MTPRPSAYIERQIDQIVAALDLDTDTRILDVGCGMGRFTLPLRARGLDVVGLELSSGLLEALEEHRPRWGLPPAPLYCADMSDPPAELLGRFDVVVGFFTLHHVHDLDACMRGAWIRADDLAERVAPLRPFFPFQLFTGVMPDAPSW